MYVCIYISLSDLIILTKVEKSKDLFKLFLNLLELKKDHFRKGIEILFV